MQRNSYPSIQNFPWKASIQAIIKSNDYKKYNDFYQYLLNDLPINSPETRKKYANVIQRRYFPNRSLNDLAASVWKVYQDERILKDIMRLNTLEAERAAADFVVNIVLPKQPGSKFNKDIIREFIVEAYSEIKKDTHNRLQKICIDLGFLGRYNKSLVVEKIPQPNNAFLIVFHNRLAETPRIVRLSEILQYEWWQYLGLRNVDEIRDIFLQAEVAGLIARFSRVDELEQITTRFSFDDYIEQALRL
jgi:hypothetical protein